MKRSLFAVAAAAVLLLAGCASSAPTGSDILPPYAPSTANLYTPTLTLADIRYETAPVMPSESDLDLYADAPVAVRAQIALIDALIEKGQFLTAWRTSCEGDYGLAKRIELAQHYYAYTMMHQMFAFKDLESGETLRDVRSSYTGDLDMVMWDPVTVVEDYIAENGESAILHMALGYYYSVIRMQYDEDWFMTLEELAHAAVAEYQKAVDLGLKLDAYQTSLWGENYMVLEDSEHAIPLLKKALAMKDDLDVHYNLATCYWNDENWEDYLALAIAEIVYCARNYDYIPYRMDAIRMLIDLCYEAEEYGLADAAADVGLVQGYDDVGTMIQVMNWYLFRENTDAATDAASNLVEMYPEEYDVLDDVASSFGNAGLFEAYNRFLELNIARYPDNNLAQANLHYFYGVYWYNFDDKPKALAEMKIARQYFMKAGVYSGDLKQALDSVIRDL